MSYEVNADKGKVHFKTKGWPNLINIHGEGKGAVGKVTITDNKASGELSFELGTLATGIELRDEHMKTKYLEVEKHPTTSLKFEDVTLPNNLNGSASFSGRLKLHGVEKKVSGVAQISKTDKGLTLKAELPIKLSDFKIEIPSYQGITVAEDVKIEFETEVSTI